MALLKSGYVCDWGNNSAGELGENLPPAGSVVPVPVWLNAKRALLRATAISSGLGSDNLAIIAKGEVVAWGENTNGEAGKGTAGNHHFIPVLVCAVGTSGTCPPGGYLTGINRRLPDRDQDDRGGRSAQPRLPVMDPNASM